MCEFCEKRKWKTPDFYEKPTGVYNNTNEKNEYENDDYYGVAAGMGIIDLDEKQKLLLTNIYTDDGHRVAMKVNYCPICGRKLVE